MTDCLWTNLVTKFVLFLGVLCLWCSCAARSAIANNLALNAPYTSYPSPNYSLTLDSTDSTKLTDGHYASGFFWTSRKETVGWQQSGTIRIEIDLRASYAIDGICLDTARGEKSGVSFPQRVDMFVSVDGEHYAYLGDLLQGNDHSDGPYQVKKFRSSRLATAGRYVTLFIQPKGEYTFVDEIEVLGSGSKLMPDKVYPIKSEELVPLQQDLNYLSHYAHALRDIADNMIEKVNNWGSEYPDASAIVAGLKRLESRLDDPAVYSDRDKLRRVQNELFDLHLGVLAPRFKDALIVWRKSPWAIFTPLDVPEPEQRIKEAVQFDLLRHGTASDAIVLTNNTPRERKYRVSVQTSRVKGTSPSIEVREAAPVLLAKSGLRADPLVVLRNGEFSIMPGESKQIWLTVRAENCDAGTYVAYVAVSDKEGKRTAVKVPLNIKIWPVDMPKDPHLMVDNWAYLNWRPIKDIPEQAVADLFAHHVNVIVVPPEQLPWPDARPASQGAAGYSKFDRYLQYHKGARKFLFFMEYNNAELRSFRGKCEFMSDGWKSVFRSWIKAWVAHLRNLGLSYDDFAFYPVDEPQNSKEAGYLVDTANAIKEIDPRLQVYTTLDSLNRLNSSDLVRIARTIDIFQVSAVSLPSLSSSALKGTGKPLWVYGEGGKIADPMGFFRSIAWQAFQNGIAGIGFWAYADTGPSGTAWNDLDGTRPDFSVIYEGANSIISSKRWEAWREGVEDYELLSQAKGKLASGAETEEFNRRVDHVAAHPDDYRFLAETRRFLLDIASRHY